MLPLLLVQEEWEVQIKGFAAANSSKYPKQLPLTRPSRAEEGPCERTGVAGATGRGLCGLTVSLACLCPDLQEEVKHKDMSCKMQG